MEINKKAIAKNKLALLFILEHAGTRLLEDQLIHICNEFSLMDYFDFSNSMAELVNNSLLDREESINGVFYKISDVGSSTLAFFQKELSYTLRTRLTAYLAQHIDALKVQSSLFAQYMQVGEGRFRVMLKVLENNAVSFELNFLTESRAEADKYAKAWREHAAQVHQAVFEALLSGAVPSQCENMHASSQNDVY